MSRCLCTKAMTVVHRCGPYVFGVIGEHPDLNRLQDR